MTNLIKSIDTNAELDNPFINVELFDGRYVLVQLEKESNRLHAGFGDWSICIDKSATNTNSDIIEDDKELSNNILSELRERFRDDVDYFENVLSLEIEEFYEKL